MQLQNRIIVICTQQQSVARRPLWADGTLTVDWI